MNPAAMDKARLALQIAAVVILVVIVWELMAIRSDVQQVCNNTAPTPFGDVHWRDCT